MNENELFQAIMQTLNNMQISIQNIEYDIKGIKESLDSMERRMDSLETRMDSLETRMDSAEKRLGNLEDDVRFIRTTLENDTNKQIRLIAECHLELDRKITYLAETSAMRINENVRINALEHDVNDLKEQMKRVVIA